MECELSDHIIESESESGSEVDIFSECISNLEKE